MSPADPFERPAGGGYRFGAAKPVSEALATALGNLGRRVRHDGEELKTRPLEVKAAGAFQAAKEGWLKLLASLNLSGADYAVGITIAMHINSRTRKAWPSIETIAQLTNRNDSTVWRSVERLAALGLLVVKKGRGRRQSNVYELRLGFMDFDPKTLRRRNKNTASSKGKDCELAVRTSE